VRGRQDIHSTDETDLFYSYLHDRMLTLKGQSCHRGKGARERVTVLPYVNSDGSGKQVLVMVGRSLKLCC
jgi:hypothetical protein